MYSLKVQLIRSSILICVSIESLIIEEKGEQFSRALEHFIFMELQAYKNYREKEFELYY